MKFIEEIEATGKIPYFNLKDEEYNSRNLEKDRPSVRIYNTKKGQKAISIINDIEINHNISWYKELKNRASRNMDALALFYRGNKISFRQLFEKVDLFAHSMAKLGIKNEDEIACCISNTPELVYTMLAANKLGAKLNLFGTHLDSSYLENILNSTTKKLFIATDDNYEKIVNVVNKCNFNNKLIFSLTDSLPKNPKNCDEYISDLDKYYYYPNLANIYKKNDSNIILFNDFINYGLDYAGKIEDKGDLDTEFLVTYTSGSTKKGFPKQIVHSNRSLIVSGTFNDLEISGSPKIPYQRGMCYIHSESNTNLITCISDSLMKLWSVSCEPEYGKDKALDVIRLNSPSMIEMTTTHLIQMAKDYLESNNKGKKYKFPNLIATFAVGEATSPGEEKLINRVLRMAKAGNKVRVKGITIPFAPLSIGGGDCEHGGIFYNVFNTIQKKKNYILVGEKDNGMAPVVFGSITALKPTKKGYEECNYNEYGVIVANTATNMVRYKNDKINTLNKIITDEIGRDWLSCDVYGYIDKAGYVHQKDRIGSEIILPNGMMILPSTIADLALKDTKNILSCCVTKYHTENGDIPIVNFEISPLSKKNKNSVILSMHNRIESQLSNILGNTICYREFDSNNQFDEAVSGKRDISSIEKKGLDRVYYITSEIGIENVPVEDKTKIYTYKK